MMARPDLPLTVEHVGRFMRTHAGERVGPVEHDPEGFGFPERDHHWRAAAGAVRVYYSADGQVHPDKTSADDIVSSWP